MSRKKPGFLSWLLAMILAPAALAQNIPRVGYVYPAGGRQGSIFQITIGGQFLQNVSNAYVSGDGVEARVIEYNRPLNQKEFNDLRDQLKVLQDKRQETSKERNTTNVWTAADQKSFEEIRAKILKNPPNRQGNPAIAETVTIQVTIATNATQGQREIRVATPNGLSNPLVFCVGQLPEFTQPVARAVPPDLERFLERLGRKPLPAKSEERINLPVAVNGQIMPGAIDRFHFSARKGQQLVMTLNARALIPYLPDAVPGWFQATLALYDAKGNELAYDNRYRFNPDPVLHYTISRDGEYVVEIKDSIYRGREDFVYRLDIGELPFVTSAFPLGGIVGKETAVELTGWNLPGTNSIQRVNFGQSGVFQLSARNGERVSNLTPFFVDTLPECIESESNNPPEHAQHVALPIIVNGRIDSPGDVDVFRFQGKAGQEIVAEALARRLNSPMDSALRLTDSAGTQLAFNDDFEDKGAGLETHHADSYLLAKLPADGTYFLHLSDTQHQGGPDCAYRLRISEPRPDFELRVVPSSINPRGSAIAPVTIYALRRDGFTNAIELELKDSPEGSVLGGARIPANQDQIRFTLTLPVRPAAEPIAITLQGRAKINGMEVIRPAIPADDLMQAFAYRHLVVANDLKVAPHNRPLGGVRARIASELPIRIPTNGTARVQLSSLPPKFADNYQLELDEPPVGVSIEGVVTNQTGVEVLLHCDGARVKSGLEGNLILTVLQNQNNATAPKGQRAANQKRAPVGILPAVPFRVLAE